MRLKDKVAIVTGGGSGIGEGTCIRLAEEGAKIAIFDIDLQGAQKTANTIEKSGGRALAFKVDVSRSSEVNAGVKETLSVFKKVDILVNNAGVSITSTIAKLSEETWDKINAVNLKGVFLCCKAVIPHMKERRYGKIINISSILGRSGSPQYVHYGATKAGIIGFTKNLAVELGRYTIQVNAIGPGIIQTPMFEHDVPESIRQQLAKKVPLQRLGVPLDMANAILFFASDESSYITGQSIFVCGGLSAAAASL